MTIDRQRMKTTSDRHRAIQTASSRIVSEPSALRPAGHQPEPIVPLVGEKAFAHQKAPALLALGVVLIQVHGISLGCVELAMSDPRSGRHPVAILRDVTSPEPEYRDEPAPLPARRSPRSPMSSWPWVPNPFPKRNPILIHDPQRAETHVPWVIIAAERKCVIRLEPAVVKVTPFVRLATADHRHLLYCCIDC